MGLLPALLMCLAAGPLPIDIVDRWGRSVMEGGVELVDWDGPIANPARSLTIRASERLQGPARVTLRCGAPLIEFELYSTIGESGSEQVLHLQSGEARSLRVRLLPHASSCQEPLEVTVEDANEHVYSLRVPVRAVAVPKPPTPRPAVKPLTIVADFGQDATGFLADPAVREIVGQALWSWTHYLGDPGFDEVPPGTQLSWIYERDSFDRGRWQAIEQPYRGFHLFFQGIRSPLRRSGGAASTHPTLQSIAGKPSGLRRSGTVILETIGNYNELGWRFLRWDQEPWLASNQSSVPHDLYSICRHEIGHALGFHRVHPIYARLASTGRFQGDRVRRYLGFAPAADPVEHFAGTVDPSSGSGAFGNEYGGSFPRKRWYVTKLDLLAMADLGYELQDRDAFWPLGCGEVRLRRGEREVSAPAWGGVPPYRFQAVGAWPRGLEIDDQTGTVRWDGEVSPVSNLTYSVEDQLGAKARGRIILPRKPGSLSARSSSG